MKCLYKSILSFLILGIVYTSCVPAFKKEINEVKIDIENPEYQKLVDFQDEQKIDSIYPFFRHHDPAFRYTAALAFASIKNPDAIDSLAMLLNDRIYKVRSAAAFALGQIGDVKAEKYLIEAYRSKDTASVDSEFNSNVLEAVGKVGSEAMLEAMSSVKTFRTSDTLLLLGQTRGIYRFAMRGIVSPKGTAKMVEYATEPKYPYKTRLMAANYLYRAKNIDLDGYKFQIANTFTTEESPEIRMVLALALGKTKNLEILNVLLSQLETEKDYRVKCNIIRSLGNFPYIHSIEKILELLNDPNEKVAYSAADFIFNNGNKDDAIIYRRFTREALPWRVKAHLFAAVNKHLPVYYTKTKNAIRNELSRLFRNSNNPYEQAAYLKAMSWDAFSYRFIKENGFTSPHAIIRTTSIEAIGTVLKYPDFSTVYRTTQRRVRNELVQYLKEAIESGDASMIAVASGILKDESLGLKDLIQDYSYLKTARDKLVLPRDIETYNEISAAISYFDGKTDYEPSTLGFNHPINWDNLSEFSDSSIVRLVTDKGDIDLELFKDLAPGSVSNFLQLSKDGYYDSKGIHRVVPNFVIQGGCPRGDGYGSLEYSIRSELYPVYYDQEGYLGMASAGNHTECTQWFITHSPTPHLDGNYTIFGKVVNGMEVVHKIEIGDSIRKVDIITL